jgi:hypothetical protein
MPHYVEKDEATAITADVANQTAEFGLGQVMTEVHRKRHISPREGIVYGVGPHDRNAHTKRFAGGHVDSDHVYSELAMNLLSDETRGTPYIENAANGQRISADRANHKCRIPDQSVNSRKLPVCAPCLILRNVLAVEYFGFVLPLQK